jgi:hypothetical protein
MKDRTMSHYGNAYSTYNREFADSHIRAAQNHADTNCGLRLKKTRMDVILSVCACK